MGRKTRRAGTALRPHAGPPLTSEGRLMHGNEMTFTGEAQIGGQEVADYTLRHKTCVEDGFSTASEGRQVVETLLAAMSQRGFPARDSFAVHLALEEAIANAIKHGHQYDPTKRVRVDYEVSGRRLLVTVTDRGEGFDPDQVPDPTLPENLEKTGGRGVMLMREFMTWIRFSNRGNQVTMCLHRSVGKPRSTGGNGRAGSPNPSL
jgi:serine/threonine-protein kinase RsbW